MGDAAMAEGDTVLDHEKGARGIVVGHTVHRSGAGRTADHDHRGFLARLHHLSALHHGRAEDETVDAKLEKGLDRLVLMLLDAISGVHQHAVAKRARARLDPRDHVREEGIVEIRNQNAHDARSLLNQTLGHRVWAIAEFGHRAQGGGAPFRAHMAVATDDQRHQGL